MCVVKKAEIEWKMWKRERTPCNYLVISINGYQRVLYDKSKAFRLGQKHALCSFKTWDQARHGKAKCTLYSQIIHAKQQQNKTQHNRIEQNRARRRRRKYGILRSHKHEIIKFICNGKNKNKTRTTQLVILYSNKIALYCNFCPVYCSVYTCFGGY